MKIDSTLGERVKLHFDSTFKYGHDVVAAQFDFDGNFSTASRTSFDGESFMIE